MSIQLVIETCKNLHENGKKPSTALVKAKLAAKGHSVRLTDIVRGMQHFSQSPEESGDTITPEPSLVKEALCPCQPHIMQLMKQIENMQEEITALQAQVKVLSTQ